MIKVMIVYMKLAPYVITEYMKNIEYIECMNKEH